MILVFMQTQMCMERIPTSSAEPPSALWGHPCVDTRASPSHLHPEGWRLGTGGRSCGPSRSYRSPDLGLTGQPPPGLGPGVFLFGSSLARWDRSLGARGSAGSASPHESAPVPLLRRCIYPETRVLFCSIISQE